MVFGANGHQWRREPPLTTDELAGLESQLDVELPAEYRSFLLQVSRGGAGPAYGLFPVQRV
ncbi:SMI1/KNR4 family protein [Micromonospora echinospora]|uniref:SMI1/KNR4 family protein n=1 Tax=Micromonospora TaxID=1873 RepID=UPI00343B9F8E